MGKSLGVVMDPIQSINYNKDTTLSLLLAAQLQGYKLFYMEQRHLFLDNGNPRAEVRPSGCLKTLTNGMSLRRPALCHLRSLMCC